MLYLRRRTLLLHLRARVVVLLPVPVRLPRVAAALQRLARRDTVRVRPLLILVLHSDELSEPVQIVCGGARIVLREARFPVLVRDAVADVLHDSGLLVCPAVECAGAHECDVRSEIAVAPAAVDADEDTERGGGPAGVLRVAVSAVLVFGAVHRSLNTLLRIG